MPEIICGYIPHQLTEDFLHFRIPQVIQIGAGCVNPCRCTRGEILLPYIVIETPQVYSSPMLGLIAFPFWEYVAPTGTTQLAQPLPSRSGWRVSCKTV